MNSATATGAPLPPRSSDIASALGCKFQRTLRPRHECGGAAGAKMAWVSGAVDSATEPSEDSAIVTHSTAKATHFQRR